MGDWHITLEAKTRKDILGQLEQIIEQAGEQYVSPELDGAEERADFDAESGAWKLPIRIDKVAIGEHIRLLIKSFGG